MSNTIVSFQDVSFYYGPPEGDAPGTAGPDGTLDAPRAVERPEEVVEVFSGLTIDLPAGVISLVGENGTGKSTMLLLAGARLFPASGRVRLFDRDTADFARAAVDPELEMERNRYVSFVYQNMEFETEEPVGELMEFVFENGYHEEGSAQGLLEDAQRELQLGGVLHKRTQELSKGELQRTIVGFSVLYGSKLVILDEPVFAVEPGRQEQTFEFLTRFAADYGTSVYYSAHNLELTRKYSDHMLLFSKGGGMQLGATDELFSRETIEAAYKVPFDMLYRKDYLHRHMLRSAHPGPGDEGPGDSEGGDGDTWRPEGDDARPGDGAGPGDSARPGDGDTGGGHTGGGLDENA
ncbi:MAG: ATP-binding cassette domain-containing protein [Spirochaetota bacterium]